MSFVDKSGVSFVELMSFVSMMKNDCLDRFLIEANLFDCISEFEDWNFLFESNHFKFHTY